MPRRQSTCDKYMKRVVKILSIFAIFEMGTTLLKPVVAAATDSNFPAEGSFAVQKQFIDGLPKGCSSNQMDAIRAVQQAENPFDIEIPGIKLEVHRHDYNVDQGVVVHRKRDDFADGVAKPKDQIQVAIGGAGAQGPVLHQFVMGKDGNLRPNGVKLIPIEEHAAGMDAAQNEGLVVSAGEHVIFGQYQRCFEAEVRPARQQA